MVKFGATKKYDALTGRFIRDIRVNDIVHLAAEFAQYSAGTIAFTALDANTELFITGFGVSSTLPANNYFYVTVGNSTILPISLAAAGHTEVTVGRDTPLAKVAANSTITICVGVSGTVGAWLSGVREPIFAKVETV